MPKKEKKLNKSCPFPALTTFLGEKPFRSDTEVTIRDTNLLHKNCSDFTERI